MSARSALGTALSGARRRPWPALVVLLVTLGATAHATRAMHGDAEAAALREVRFGAEEIRRKIEDRLERQEEILRAGATLYDTFGGMTRADWRTFVERQRIVRRLRGVQGVGICVHIPRDELARHTAEVRAEGFPQYRVFPEGDREAYSSIVYIEPFVDRNLRAFGYDMFSEPVRRAAMERARDGGVTALTGKVVLVQETEVDVQPGALMYVPIYKKGMPASTVAERRAAIAGWVYIPYRMRDLMHGILGGWEHQRLQLEVYDGPTPTRESLLYDSHSDPAHATERLYVDTEVTFGGHRWTLRFAPLHGGRPDLGRMWLVLAGGITVSVLLSALTFAILRTQSHAHDMAQRMTSELRESEARFRTMADTAPVLVWAADPDGQSEYFNRVWLDFTGRTMEQECGDGWTEGIHPDDRDRCLDNYRSSFEARRPFSMEYRLRRADGAYRWLIGSGVPRFLPDGAFAGYIGSCVDISALKETEDALRRSRALLQAIADGTSDAVYVKDLEGRYTMFNRAAEVFTGKAASDALGHDDRFLFPADEAKVVMAGDRKVVEGGKVATYEEDITTVHGKHTIFLATKGPIFGDGGEPVGLFGIARDITQRKQTEQRLQRALDEKVTLVKEVHHRVKNNLQVMISLLALQAEQIGEPHAAAALRDSAERLRSMALVHEQLYRSPDLSRIDIARYAHALTRGLLGVFGPREGVAVDVSEREVWLAVDTAVPCGLIINELVSNALKYAFPGDRKGRIVVEIETASAASAARDVVLCVRDDGIGLPNGIDPAHTTTLGLRLVHILARQLGGTVTVERGDGTRFFIAFREEGAAEA